MDKWLHNRTKAVMNETRLCYQDRSSAPEVFLGKGVREICSKFTGEHPYPSVNSIKLQSNFGMDVLL